MDAATVTAPMTPGEQVFAKTICLALRIGSFGNTKQASLAPVQVHADKSLLSLSKKLLDSPELYEIQKFDRHISAQIRAIAFPSLFKGGVYLLPIGMVTTVQEILTAAIEKRKILVEAACEMYATRIAETTARLGDVAVATDYPSVERFRAAFYIEYQYVTFDTPTRLEAISAALFQAEVEKQRSRLESVADECQQAMRAGLLKLVEHLSERLTPDADGKSKRLSNSTIANLNEFLKVFELRDVTGDTQLAGIVVQARAVMEGVDHKKLKTDEFVRQQVLSQLEGLKTSLNPLVIDQGMREITFDDE